MATIVETERLEIAVMGYEIQRRDWQDGEPVWVLCYATPGYDLPEFKMVPCEYNDVTEARARLAKFREDHPETPYRMLRYVTITEVVE